MSGATGRYAGFIEARPLAPAAAIVVVALFWAVNAIVTGDWVSSALCVISLAALAGYLQDLKHRRRHGG